MSVVDLDTVIKRWVLAYNGDYTEDDEITIKWHKVHMKTMDPPPAQFQPHQLHMYQGGPPSRQAPAPAPAPAPTQIVYTSNYTNNTKEEQMHTFLVERTTESTVRTRVTKGFSKGGKVGIKIDVPDNVRNLTGSFGSDVDVVNQEENTVRYSATWRVDSPVRVMPYHRATAELRITEKDYSCPFTTDVVIRGIVIVQVNDNVMQGNIATILKDEMAERRFDPQGMVKFEENKVVWRVEGNLNFRFGISQETVVTSTPISGF